MNKLTVRQSEVLGSIVNYQRRFGFPPTICELAGLIGCSSPNAAAEHVKAIAKKGYISVAPGVSRGITVITDSNENDAISIIKSLLNGDIESRQRALSWLEARGVQQ
ncbi:LexA family transcriptional regulator [Escherichia coli]|nr:LexA family transcriptional regulator [Citrobacter freundii]EFB9975106.1 LexA family transcriptional regulator [Escherichia coli]EHQ2018154.1 LexA family transcriptional regulator [Salmonella enterica]EFC0518697.1 LexA family transcriptional regulator [Escherichia coli]EFC0533595.1 LexA family transcriptional regulator [Escherichia coli]EFC0537989.1 LexA family transcriptional regulator [Escherichia coli]